MKLSGMDIIRRYHSRKDNMATDFLMQISDLLDNELVQRLDGYKQHYTYTRLRHSMDVAYAGFVAATILGWDARSVARAGLLHDLFFNAEGQGEHSLLFSHPKIALENASSICGLNELERDIILKHMWLLTFSMPKFKESFLVTFVDKYCATREFIVSVFTRRRVRAAVLTSGN